MKIGDTVTLLKKDYTISVSYPSKPTDFHIVKKNYCLALRNAFGNYSYKMQPIGNNYKNKGSIITRIK